MGFRVNLLFVLTLFYLSSCVSIEYGSLQGQQGAPPNLLPKDFTRSYQEISPNPYSNHEFEDRDWEEGYYQRQGRHWYGPHDEKILLWIFEGRRMALTIREAYDFILRRSLECECPLKIELYKSKCYIKAKPTEDKFLWFRWKGIKVKSNCWEDFIYQY